MIIRGFNEQQANDFIREATTNDAFKEAQSVARRANNLEALLGVYRSLEKQRVGHDSIDRICNLSPEEFHQKYYVTNRPVVITDLLNDWPALRKWSPTYLRNRFENVLVKVQTNRKPNPVYEVFLKGHDTEVKFGDFMDTIDVAKPTNEYYLTANDGLLSIPDMRSLFDDFHPFPKYLTSAQTHQKQFIWIGPSGVVSPLHRDRLNVLMTQVVGRKRVKLIHSAALPLIYNFESFFSAVDVDCPDLNRYPKFAKAEILEVELEPGDALLIPVGWWHHVRALEFSINVSFTNFAFPNDFENLYGHTT
ncbi:MAG: cupin-like domain-containing protein [Gammaproteobacteria bacterium]|nr:cupin-like domain-containing protein [Gammaproteobacteria bacterium]